MTNTGAYITDIEAWRKTLDVQLRAPDGWLTVAGLTWLQAGENSIGSAEDNAITLPADTPPHVGVITLNGDEITLQITTDEPIIIDGEPATSATLRHDHAERGATLVTICDVTIHIIKRGDLYGVRMRDPNSETRRNFTGRQWFEVDPAYRVTGKFHPHNETKSVEVETSNGSVTRLNSLGVVTFELNGAQQQLIAFESAPEELWFIFRDGTSGGSTYGSGRFLMATIKNELVDLDFNRSHSPPCAFTAYATCPLPPKENRLPFPVSVGEKYVAH